MKGFFLVTGILTLLSCFLESADVSQKNGPQTSLPWRSMPDIFSKKSAKQIAKEQERENYLLSQIELLKEDNEELKNRLLDSWSNQNEIYKSQQELLINLELELARTQVLRQTLTTVYQKWKHLKNQSKNIVIDEKGTLQISEYQAEIQKLKQDLNMLAEAFAASQKDLDDLQRKQTSLEHAVAVEEDFDLNENDLKDL